MSVSALERVPAAGKDVVTRGEAFSASRRMLTGEVGGRTQHQRKGRGGQSNGNNNSSGIGGSVGLLTLPSGRYRFSFLFTGNGYGDYHAAL